MTRRRRRASSSPQRVGSDEDLTSTRPTPPREADAREPAAPEEQPTADPEEQTALRRGNVEQTRDDTDEGWGERSSDDPTGRWVRENRPPHWS